MSRQMPNVQLCFHAGKKQLFLYLVMQLCYFQLQMDQNIYSEVTVTRLQEPKPSGKPMESDLFNRDPNDLNPGLKVPSPN